MPNTDRCAWAAQALTDSLEGQDRALLCHLTGHHVQARLLYRDNVVRFERAAVLVATSTTAPGEALIVVDIRRQFRRYWQEAQVFLATSPDWSPSLYQTYFRQLEPDFLRLKQRCDDLLRLHQRAMREAGERTEARATTVPQRVLSALGRVAGNGRFAAFRVTRALGESLLRLRPAALAIGSGP